MKKSLDDELIILFEQAESNHMCLVPPTQRLRDALNRRMNSYMTNLPIVRPYSGIYARRDKWDALDPTQQTIHAARALYTKHPTWVFADVTAATIRGWNVSYALLEEIHLGSTYHRRANAVVSRTSKQVEHELVDGLPVTSAEQTLFDCLRTRDLRLSLPIVDSALRQLNLSAKEAVTWLEQYEPIKGRAYFKRVLDTVKLADPRSESGGESVARATMIALGFAMPELQVEYRDPIEPGRIMRADFKWELPDGTVILGELDGRQKYVDPAMTKGKSSVDVLRQERIRESRLSLTGARIVRFSFDDVCDEYYFAHLLESYGVPHASYPPRIKLLSDLDSIRGSGTYDELPPLECYADLIAMYGNPWQWR